MGTRKDYAISLGLAKAGRGRMSGEAHAAIDKARSQGMTFTDDIIVAKTPKAIKPAKEPKVRESGPVATVGDPIMRHSLDQIFKGTDSTGRVRTVNARQVCYHCGYSLTSHRCNSPRVLIGNPLEHIDVQPV